MRGCYSDGSGATRAVIGVPGRVDHAVGRLEYAPNLPIHWATHLTEDELADRIGLQVSLANDADLAAVGSSALARVGGRWTSCT